MLFADSFLGADKAFHRQEADDGRDSGIGWLRLRILGYHLMHINFLAALPQYLHQLKLCPRQCEFVSFLLHNIIDD